MAGRLFPPRDPVTFTFDGTKVVAERGEPIAAALLAAGMWTVARSPKYHRPRAPSCMRGACDGCLARVDGAPNIMTCMTAAEAGAEVISQNTLGSREIDLLRVTDWFFPDGMNHHELFAGVPGVQAAMQVFARRVAGLGRLPDAGRPVRTAVRRQVEVLVVGAGPAGMAMALAAARSGRKVEVVDDALVPGGGSRGLRSGDSELFARVRDTFDRATKAGEVRVRSRTVAAGVFGRDVLVVSAEEDGSVELVDAKTLVIAAGAHDGVAPFGNNDLPGVMSARAAAMLAAAGVSLGKEFVALVPRGVDGTGAVSFADAFESATSAGAVGRPTPRFTRVTDVLRVKGASQLRAVVVKDGDGERSIPADVLLVDVPRAPAYELCEQAGAKLSLGRGGYAPLLDRGRIAPGVFAIGEVTGIELDPARFVVDAEEIAAQIE